MSVSESEPPKCPDCSRPLMSRMSMLCSWCGAKIPEELRFTSEEMKQIEAAETTARKEREAKQQEQQRRKRGGNSLLGRIFSLGLRPPTDFS